MSGFESDRLVTILQDLCAQLKRPVSSKDLLTHFRRHPDARPLLLQRLGQTLFKLGSRNEARIFRMGLIGNLAFYAPDKSSDWVERFERHRAAVHINEQLFLRMPEHAQAILGTKFDSLARNALAGFIAEWFPVWRRLGRAAPAEFHSLLELAERHSAPEFVPGAPPCITRAEAAELLREGYARRTPLSEPTALNVARHLVHLRPSALLPVPSESFWADRIHVYCGARWPVSEAESRYCRGLSLCMNYGDFGVSDQRQDQKLPSR